MKSVIKDYTEVLDFYAKMMTWPKDQHWSFERIGKAWGVSRQRIHALVHSKRAKEYFAARGV